MEHQKSAILVHRRDISREAKRAFCPPDKWFCPPELYLHDKIDFNMIQVLSPSIFERLD